MRSKKITTKLMTLVDPDAQYEFYKYLANHTSEFAKGKNHDAAYAKMILGLRSVNIITCLGDLRKLRNQAMAKYRALRAKNETESWTFYHAMAVHNGHMPFAALEGTRLKDFITEPTPSGSSSHSAAVAFSVDVSQFTKGLCSVLDCYLTYTA